MDRIRYKIAEELAKIAEELITAGRPRMTKEEFVERAREIHGDAYDYSKVDMDNRDDKGRVYIICKRCGQGFWQRPDKHLDGNGCMNCYVKETGITPGESAMPEMVPQTMPPAQPPAGAPIPPQPVQQTPSTKSQYQQTKPLAQPVVKG